MSKQHLSMLLTPGVITKLQHPTASACSSSAVCLSWCVTCKAQPPEYPETCMSPTKICSTIKMYLHLAEQATDHAVEDLYHGQGNRETFKRHPERDYLTQQHKAAAMHWLPCSLNFLVVFPILPAILHIHKQNLQFFYHLPGLTPQKGTVTQNTSQFERPQSPLI